MRASDPKITIHGTHLGESARAIKFRIEKIDGDTLDPPVESWFPFSQTSKVFKDPKTEGQDYLVVSEWIMKQKELI